MCETVYIRMHLIASDDRPRTFPGSNINTLRDYALKEGIKHYSRGKG